jgi:hypothetical protein
VLTSETGGGTPPEPAAEDGYATVTNWSSNPW